MLYFRLKFALVVCSAAAILLGPALAGVGSGGDSGGGLLGASVAEARSDRGQTPRQNVRSLGNRVHRRSSTRRGYRSSTARRRPSRQNVRRRRPVNSGHGVGKSKLRSAPLGRPSGLLWVYSENLHEEVSVQLYDGQGEFDDASLAALDHQFRCKRTREERAVDPRLYEMLSRIQDHFEGRRILLVSGFRFQRNESSRHYHASAMDIRIPGVSTRKLRDFAASLDVGGMGIGLYPRSNFVHVDFRAPGEPSYRWTDYSRPGGSAHKRGHRRSRRAKSRRARNS